MAFSSEAAGHGKFNFGHAVAGFLGASGLPFASLLSEERVAAVFHRHKNQFGRTYTTALGASSVCDQHPRDISFVTCCQFVLASWDVVNEKSYWSRVAYCLGRLRQIGKCIVGNRPGRFEPRVRKKRPSNYNLMMKPRQQLRDRLETGDNSFE